MSNFPVGKWLAAAAACALAAGVAAAQDRPVFLSGTVVTDDGTPPPKKADIELVCNGSPQKEGQTDSKGDFGVQLGSKAYQGASDITARSASGNLGQSAGGAQQVSTLVNGLMGCGLRASLEGYVSSVIELSGRRLLDNPDVGAITLTKMKETEGATVSITTMQAPRNAKRSFDNGTKALGNQKFENAEKELIKATTEYPAYAEAWNALGEAQLKLRKNAEAVESFKKAVAADDRFTKPYMSLAMISAQLQNWQDTAQYSDTLVRLDPYSYPQAYYTNAVAYYNLQDADKALASAQQAVKLDTLHQMPQAEQLLGLLLASRGDYQGAAEALRGFLMHAPPNMNTDMAKKLLADFESKLGAAGAAAQQ